MDCVLSFTTWRKRIYDHRLLYVIQHALSQKTKHDYKVVLALSEEEFKNKEKDVPSEILELEKLCGGKFEILWTYKNTRALKKLDPAREKYPDVPIITFDDDEILAPTCLDKMMSEHEKTPDMILGADCHKLKRGGRVYDQLWLVTHVRLFPPHSLANIEQDIFSTVFKSAEDDIFNALRAAVKGTKSRKVGIDKLTVDEKWFPSLYPSDTSLGREYRFLNANRMIEELCAKYNKYKKFCA